MIDHADFVEQFIDSFARRYNNGSRIIPEIRGWHLHMYANWGGVPVDSPLAAVTDAILDSSVEQHRSQIATFIARRQADGNSPKIYFDETGLLLHLSAATRDGTPAQYSERMAYLLRKQDAMLRSFRPTVEGYEWFSVYAGSPYCTTDCTWNAWNASNMLLPDRTLLPVGIAWRELATQQ